MKNFLQIIKTLMEDRSIKTIKAHEGSGPLQDTFGNNKPDFESIIASFQGSHYKKKDFYEIFHANEIRGNRFRIEWKDGTKLDGFSYPHETYLKWGNRKDGGPDHVHIPKHTSSAWKEVWDNPKPGEMKIRQMDSGTYDEIYVLKRGVYSLEKRVYQGTSLQIEIWTDGADGSYEVIPSRSKIDRFWQGREDKTKKDEEGIEKALATRSRDYPILRGRPKKTNTR